MNARGSRTALALTAIVAAGWAVGALATDARGDVPLPPWIDEGEVPPPAWARSVVPRPDSRGLFAQPEEQGDTPAGTERSTGEASGGAQGLVLFAGPTRASARRGVAALGTSLPFFGSKRGSGCSGSWWLVGALAWTCSDDAQLSAEGPSTRDRVLDAVGLASQYMFVRSGGASAYATLESARSGEAEEELEGGWAVAVVEQREADGERWARTSRGLWLSMQDLAPARPSTFRGEKVSDGRLDFAWVLSARASVWSSPSSKDKPIDVRSRFQLVRVLGESGPMVQVTDGAWMRASDLARPRPSPVPAEVAGADEGWIDVDSANQTLVAYQGARPIYATLASTGLGLADATPLGLHRIWVKILASDMGNVQHEDREAHFLLENVPYVQFFDSAVGLHGTYWHGDFGHPRSHGCVNLSPLDARWMFDFTEPRLPIGWSAAYPTAIDPGTLVRVR